MLKIQDRQFALGAVVCAGLSLFGLCAISVALMRPAAAQAPEPPDVPTTDVTALNPRWLQLIRSSSSKSGFAPAQAQSPQTLNVLISDRAVAGRVSTGQTVYISHTRGVTLVANASIRPLVDGGSFLYATQFPALVFCPLNAPCLNPEFEPGDVVQVSQAGSVLTMTIPTLTAASYAKDDVIRGAAPVSQTVSVSWYSASDTSLSATRIVTANAERDYEASFAGSADVRAKDTGFVILTIGANTTAAQQYVAPFMRAQISGSVVTGFVLPNQVLGIQVKNMTDTLSSGGYSGPDGAFTVNLSYNPANVLKPGDVVLALAGSQPFSMTLENITARASYSLAQVSGVAPANRSIELALAPGPVSQNSYMTPVYTPTQRVTSSATGAFTAAVALQPADFGLASVADAEGHQTAARFVLPYLRARMGNAVFNVNGYPTYYDAIPVIGQFDPQTVISAPLTITVQGKSGFLKDIRSAYLVNESGYFAMSLNYNEGVNGAPALLAGGDVVTVASRAGAHMVIKLPTLTAFANPATDGVTGTAPPNAVLQISLGSGYAIPPQPAPTAVPAVPALTATPPPFAPTPAPVPCCYYPPAAITQIVTASANGIFTASFAGLLDVTNQTVGEVSWASPEGFVAVQPFRVIEYCAPRIGEINLTRQFININQQYNCPSYHIRLVDANGITKGEYVLNYATYNLFFPQPMLPGDALELTSNGQTTRVVIPGLSVKLDSASDVITGTAPPNSFAQVSLSSSGGTYYDGIPFGSTYFTATAGASGQFTRSLKDMFDIAPGTIVRMVASSDLYSEPYFVAESAIPWMRAHAYQQYIDVALPEIGPITLTMQSAGVLTSTNFFPSYYGQGFSALRLGLPVNAKPGDRIIVSSKQTVISLTVPALTAKLDVMKRTVTGQAPPLSRLRVQVYGDVTYPYDVSSLSQIVTATASGAFTATFTTVEKLASTGVLIYQTPDGNEVLLSLGSQRWSVTVGERYVTGRSVLSTGNITLNLRSANGALKSSAPTYIEQGGNFSAMFTETVAAGDRLEVVLPGNVQSFTVPAITARHDLSRNVVEGTARPNVFIKVTFGGVPSPYPQYATNATTRLTQADASGRFTLEATGIPFQLGETGYVTYEDADGNTTNALFQISGYKRFLPLVVR